MDFKHHRPKTHDRPLSRTQKLKDTCDMCSASKVKCDKQKPICSRCERLGYPCFFSPARRIRKRHYVQDLSSSSRSRATENAPESHITTTGRISSIIADSNASDEISDSGPRDNTHGARTAGLEKSYSATLVDDSNNMVQPDASNHDSNSLNAQTPMLEALNHGKSPFFTGSETDCVMVAISMLQDLNYTMNVKSLGPTSLTKKELYGANLP